MTETAARPRVALLGLGIMGAGMASRLLSANFPLAVFNRSRDKAAPLAAAGATVAPTPREAAAGAQIIFSMVANDQASRDVWLGDSGALAGASAGAIAIECSTLSTDWIHTLAAKAAERGCHFLDAPVTGTKPHAASGELLFLVGGSPETIELARPAFNVLGRDVIHLGPTGSGSLMKLVNNFLCGIQAASFAESLALAEAGGLDREKVIGILTSGAPGSGIVKRIAERIALQDFAPVFATRWMSKDIDYAINAASAEGISLPVASAASGAFHRAVADGLGDQDFAAITKLSHARSDP
jgi:3-hydroxyisobutyrate dehydrogenase